MKISKTIILPQVWEKKKLKEVITEIKDGGTPSRSKPEYFGGDIGWCVVKDITPKIYSTRETLTELGLSKCSAKVWPINSVIISLGATIGQVGIAKIPVATKQGISGIVVKENLLNVEYLVYYLNFKKEFIQESATGATIKEIRPTKLAEIIEIPLPPLPEQQRIVAILDDAFAKIEKAKANAEQNLKNAKELFESYLQRVFENKGDDWEEKKLFEITNKIGSGATPRGGNESYKSEGISLVRSMNVHDLEFRDKNLAFIDDQQAKELNNVSLQENDVLLNITGASVARCCVIPKKFLPARVNQHVSIIRAKKEIIDPIFLNLLLTSKFYKDQLLFTGEQGATRQAITKAQLEVFKIAFPKSIKEQKSLINKLEALSLETKKLEAIYDQKIKELEELKKSVLQKAFSGEL